MKNSKTCSVCGITSIDSYIVSSVKYEGEFCLKHYRQMKCYGRITSPARRKMTDPNEIVIYKGYAEVVMYSRHCEETARAVIDLCDITLVSSIKWRLDKDGYARGGNPNTPMHRLINNTPDGYETDHINRDRLDNRRSNFICN